LCIFFITDKWQSSGSTVTSSYQDENLHRQSAIVTTITTRPSNSIQKNSGNARQSLLGSILSGNRLNFFLLFNAFPRFFST
jgi:hypothetical protein